MVRGHVRRGVSFRRARVVSEPVSGHIRTSTRSLLRPPHGR
ncbi:DUF6879 family protein [Sphaerisporangium flaviroseum]